MQKELLLLFEALERKNSYLLEFHKINMEELTRLSNGRIDNLENFYYSRELLLNAINKLDDSISKNKWNENLKINKAEKKRIKDMLNLRRKMIMSIVDQDLTILSLVDKIQDKELKSLAS